MPFRRKSEDHPVDLASVALGAREVPGYRLTTDRPQPPDKLAAGATEGHVRGWNGGPGGQYLIAVTIQRFGHPSSAKRFARREKRSARGATGSFPVPAVPGAEGLQTRKAAAMPDGRDGFGNVIVFTVGSLGVALSHLGPSQQPAELVATLARQQYQRLRPP